LPERLLNPRFTSTFIHATLIAMRTHQEEKLEALRNAVINSALPKAPEDDLQLMFLNLIDQFGEWHIRLLKFYSNPAKTVEQKYGPDTSKHPQDSVNVMEVVEAVFPELVGQK